MPINISNTRSFYFTLFLCFILIFPVDVFFEDSWTDNLQDQYHDTHSYGQVTHDQTDQSCGHKEADTNPIG